MINKIGRDIPDFLLKDGKKVFAGNNACDGVIFTKAAPAVRACVTPQESKVAASLTDALLKCGIRDGMYISFHHHFRDGDYVVNMVMAAIAELGIKDITICATSLGDAHDPIGAHIESGVVRGIQTSGVRGKIGDAISHGKLKDVAIVRSHGGRVRAIEQGDIHLDIAFIGAPTSDECGNARGKGGKSDCGVLSYSMVDAKYADKVVVITDTLVQFPNFPPSIEAIDVDHVVVVDSIGNPKKIANATLRISQDPRDLMMGQYCAEVMAATEYFKEGFSYQTGAGGPSLASIRFLKAQMDKKNIKMKWAIGGISTPLIDLFNAGYVDTIVDAQDFDLGAIASVHTPRHFEISTSQYANPMNKGAFVNKLDFVVLAALEVDVDFNVNVVTGSDGVLRGAPGGHPDTAAGAKCTIITTPLTRGRMATVCDRVVTVTTPGESVDILVTDYGIAVNPLRPDLLAALSLTKLPLRTIEELRDIAYSVTGRPDDLVFDDKVVAIVEARDGTILDIVRKIKPYEL